MQVCYENSIRKYESIQQRLRRLTQTNCSIDTSKQSWFNHKRVITNQKSNQNSLNESQTAKQQIQPNLKSQTSAISSRKISHLDMCLKENTRTSPIKKQKLEVNHQHVHDNSYEKSPQIVHHHFEQNHHPIAFNNNPNENNISVDLINPHEQQLSCDQKRQENIYKSQLDQYTSKHNHQRRGSGSLSRSNQCITDSQEADMDLRANNGLMSHSKSKSLRNKGFISERKKNNQQFLFSKKMLQQLRSGFRSQHRNHFSRQLPIQPKKQQRQRAWNLQNQTQLYGNQRISSSVNRPKQPIMYRIHSQENQNTKQQFTQSELLKEIQKNKTVNYRQNYKSEIEVYAKDYPQKSDFSKAKRNFPKIQDNQTQQIGSFSFKQNPLSEVLKQAQKPLRKYLNLGSTNMKLPLERMPGRIKRNK